MLSYGQSPSRSPQFQFWFSSIFAQFSKKIFWFWANMDEWMILVWYCQHSFVLSIIIWVLAPLLKKVGVKFNNLHLRKIVKTKKYLWIAQPVIKISSNCQASFIDRSDYFSQFLTSLDKFGKILEKFSDILTSFSNLQQHQRGQRRPSSHQDHHVFASTQCQVCSILRPGTAWNLLDQQLSQG